ncbi:hypothetical protein ACFWPX_16260 [Nocardia sp. NPDC058518]|uniref:hypothetical protein n=1 Tax=Nocardia sp. NPDC058518 TaxID=3346534 RepID=UPI0036579977
MFRLRVGALLANTTALVLWDGPGQRDWARWGDNWTDHAQPAHVLSSIAETDDAAMILPAARSHDRLPGVLDASREAECRWPAVRRRRM